GEYPLLKLDSRTNYVLFNKEQVVIRLKEAEAKSHVQSGIPNSVAVQGSLFASLKVVRTRLAQIEKVPPYLIFSDATLQELAQYLPLTLEDMNKISGFGEFKIKKYGEQFLITIQDYCQENNLQTMINEKIPKKVRR
ncbi:MAG: HRDC domain-containing protein, partial [Saprospiraceae bacterium]